MKKRLLLLAVLTGFLNAQASESFGKLPKLDDTYFCKSIKVNKEGTIGKPELYVEVMKTNEKRNKLTYGEYYNGKADFDDPIVYKWGVNEKVGELVVLSSPRQSVSRSIYEEEGFMLWTYIDEAGSVGNRDEGDFVKRAVHFEYYVDGTGEITTMLKKTVIDIGSKKGSLKRVEHLAACSSNKEERDSEFTKVVKSFREGITESK